jgi:DNA-binding NarL/FixJ family response regulator
MVENAVPHAAPVRVAAKTKILLVDDHPLVLYGLAQLLNAEPDLTVCAQAANPVEALAAAESCVPDLAIVDLNLGETDGLDLIKSLLERRADLPVLVVSMHKESLYAERALRAGARGYVMKREATQALVGAVRRVLAGQIHVSERMASVLLTKLARGEQAGDSAAALRRLSDREFEVFRLMGKGLGPTEIAAKLGLSVKTIETYQDHLKRKLNASTGRELLRLAMAHAMEEGGAQRDQKET